MEEKRKKKNLLFQNKGQMKIQQMAFMLVAVFFFFVLVGLFFLGIQFKDLRGSASQLQRAQAISSLGTIADMPELNYDSSESMTIDKDKLRIMSDDFGKNYSSFWPVASVEVYKIHPIFDIPIECPSADCNYYKLYDNKQNGIRTYSGYVSICEKTKEGGSVYDRCEVGKLVVGMEINE